MNEYTVIVQFTRLHSDDDILVREKFGNINKESLAQQLIQELQECCNEGVIGGQFKVLSVIDNQGNDVYSDRETDNAQ